MELQDEFPNYDARDDIEMHIKYCLLDTLINECKELNPWQPIESAPIGKRIRLFSPKSYMPNQSECQLYDESEKEHFTHWQELPEDPKE